MKLQHLKNHITSYKKIYQLLIISLIFQFFFIINLHSKEQIGLITDKKGVIYKTNSDGVKIQLNLYDSIFTNEEVFTSVNDAATILFNDNTSMLLQKSSSFMVNEFILSNAEVNLFNLLIKKGGAIIESGTIAKNGSMKVTTKNLTLGIKGTRFNIKNELNGSSTVSLAKDSFGKVGSVNVSSEGNLKTLFDPTQVLSAEQGNEIIERPATEFETKELENASEEFIQSSKIDENIIQKNLENQFINGSLKDANNDGKVDVSDIEFLKQIVKSNKQEKIIFITDNSDEDNVTFLSNVLNASDDGSIGESINEILETKNNLISILVSNLSDADSTFITTSKNEINNEIKDRIYNQILSDDSNEDFNLEVISKIISKSDKETVSMIIDNVQNQSENDTNTNTSLKVLSAVATFNNNESVNLDDEQQIEVNRLIEQALERSEDNDEDSSLLANIIIKSDISLIEELVDLIQDLEDEDENSNISLKILSSVATIQSDEAISLESDEQTEVNRLIEQAVERAEDNAEDSSLLANVIAKSDVSVISDVVDLIQDLEDEDEDSNISLKILSSIIDIQSDEAISLESDEQTQVNRLIREALLRSSDEDQEALEEILENIESEIEEIIEEIIEEAEEEAAEEAAEEAEEEAEEEAAEEEAAEEAAEEEAAEEEAAEEGEEEEEEEEGDQQEKMKMKRKKKKKKRKRRM